MEIGAKLGMSVPASGAKKSLAEKVMFAGRLIAAPVAGQSGTAKAAATEVVVQVVVPLILIANEWVP
jgi:hypothetical protein